LASIRTISENAVGYSQTRGDRLEVVSMDFGSREMAAGGGGGGFSIQATIVESIRAIAIGLAIVAALWILFFIIRSISHTLDPSRLQIPADIEFEKKKSKISGEDEIEKETEKAVLVRKIVSKAIKDPEAIARSLKTFYPEG
jgi:flagellar biosynthesis/type III secretory pathway M-ring protein FliF/YscJ